MQQKQLLKGVAVAVTLMVSVALSGCGSNSQDGSKSATLNLLLVDEEATQELRDVYLPEFEEETGIKVNAELVPESGMAAKLGLSLGGGSNEFDVVETGAKNLSTLVASGWIQPLDSFLEDTKLSPNKYTDGFSDTLLGSLEHGGKTYSMPYQVGADLLYYNKTMFEKAGLDPADPPRTMEEIVEAAEALNIPEKDQAGFVARGTREGNQNSFAWIMMWFLNGGRWVGQDGEPNYSVLTEEEAVKTTEQYTELMTKYAPKGSTNYGFLEAQTAMQQGEAAMWIDAAQLGPTLEDESASSIAGNVGYAAPRGEDDDYIVGAVWGFSMVEGSEKAEESWELIKFLTSKDVAVEQAVSGTNGSPARADALSDPEVMKAYNPEYLAAMSEALDHANPLYTPVVPQGTEIRSALSVALSKILSGQAALEPAMKEANEQIEQLLK